MSRNAKIFIYRKRIVEIFTKDLECEGWGSPCKRIDAVRYHMNTAYVNVESNFMNLCPGCQKNSDEHWEEMWKEYNSGCL